MRPQSSNQTIAIIGGGRWGRVTLSVLAKMNLAYHTVMVSRVNHDNVKILLENLPSTSFSLVHSVTDLLSQYEIKAAIVVNSAREHFETALQLIHQGIHVLVEKPIVLSMHEMNILDKAACKNGVIVVPGLCYFFCSYLENFSKLIHKGRIPHSFKLEWADACGEVRYQETKSHDGSINIIQDVIPHVWTILATVFRKAVVNVDFCDYNSLNDYAKLFVTIENIHGEIILSRNAFERKRILTVNFLQGSNAAIDFTAEPGVIMERGRGIPGDRDWELRESPLTRQINYFLSRIDEKRSNRKDIEACYHSIKMSEAASSFLQKKLAK